MASECVRPPLREVDGSATPPPPHNTPEHPAPPPPASVVSRDDLSAVAAKAEASAAAGSDDWYSWSGQRESAPTARSSRVWFSQASQREAPSEAVPPPAGSRVVNGIVQRERRAEVVQRTAVGARLAAAALCLVAFSVLAADKEKGWALDSYNLYKQFRYCVSVNVIGFLYSGFQVYAQVHHMITKKHIIRRPMGGYFDFAMDQILAYLLISSSSSATARTDDWVSNWGTDPFPNMATGSVAVSFLAFFAFALSALISAHNLFSPSL